MAEGTEADAEVVFGVGVVDGAPDTQGVLGQVLSLPSQLTSAVDLVGVAGRLPQRDFVENVVILGMGAAGLVGDMTVAVAQPFLSVPMTVVKGYALPDFVGSGSLVFAVSYSGDTEETVESAGEAYEAGAHVVVVAGGGELLRLAREWESPLIELDAGFSQERFALGAMIGAVLRVLDEVGLYPGARQWLDQTAEHLSQRCEELAKPGNIAAQIAKRIGRTMTLIHAAEPVGAAAAGRWKSQLNQNSKVPAFVAVFPDLCHDELAGWGQHGDFTRQVITLINLRHDGEHPQVSRRFELTDDHLREVVADVIDVRAKGDGELTQLLDLVLIGDVTSLYLAAQEGVDPGPVPIIDDVADALRSRTGVTTPSTGHVQIHQDLPLNQED